MQKVLFAEFADFWAKLTVNTPIVKMRQSSPFEF
jgi:hypothetical protein